MVLANHVSENDETRGGTVGALSGHDTVKEGPAPHPGDAPMPRYFFNVSDGHSLAFDHEGTELRDQDGARAEALAGARHLLSESDGWGLCRRHWLMNVTDPAGTLVFKLPFAHALEPDHLGAVDRRKRA